MKKILFATTAMATAGLIAGGAGDAAAAERIAIEVHGFHQQWIVGLDQDFTDTDAERTPRGFKSTTIDQKTNSEICFTGQTTLDNGISVGVQIELEAGTNTDFNIDETFLFLQSERMGQFKLGAEDSVTDLLHVSAPNGGVSVDDGDVVNVGMYVNTAGAQSVILSSTSLGDLSTPGGIRSGDSNRIMYTTPRYAGFQAGISYAPQAAEDSNTSVNPEYGGVFNSNGRYHDSVEGALNYREAFGGVGVQLSTGIRYMNQTDDLSIAGVDPGNMFGYSFGGQLTFGGFTVGGAYRKITSGRDTPVVAGTRIQDLRSIQSDVWSAGARYEVGPYAAGVSCISGEAVGWQAAGTGDLEHFNCTLSGTYTLGPGIRLIGGLFMFDDEAETPVGPAAATIRNTSDTDGWGGTIALTATF